MKKLLLIMAVAGFVACNNKAEKKETTADTTAKVTPTVDTTKKVDTSKAATVDTTKKVK